MTSSSGRILGNQAKGILQPKRGRKGEAIRSWAIQGNPTKKPPSIPLLQEIRKLAVPPAYDLGFSPRRAPDQSLSTFTAVYPRPPSHTSYTIIIYTLPLSLSLSTTNTCLMALYIPRNEYLQHGCSMRL